MVVVMATCHCRNNNMVMTMRVMVEPKRAQFPHPEVSRSPFCAVVRAELDKARSGRRFKLNTM
eukprot:12602555-Alexandrium_andersonii.AAC.1